MHGERRDAHLRAGRDGHLRAARGARAQEPRAAGRVGLEEREELAPCVSAQSAAVTPGIAPLTITSRGLRAGSASARGLKVHGSPSNSCEVYDMPSEISTILPSTGSGLPSTSRGTISVCAMARPAASCAGGRVLWPPG
jgi:hypothetical protein